MIIEIKIKKWSENMKEWIERTVTFHKVNQCWQSVEGNITLELIRVET